MGYIFDFSFIRDCSCYLKNLGSSSIQDNMISVREIWGQKEKLQIPLVQAKQFPRNHLENTQTKRSLSAPKCHPSQTEGKWRNKSLSCTIKFFKHSETLKTIYVPDWTRNRTELTTYLDKYQVLQARKPLLVRGILMKFIIKLR